MSKENEFFKDIFELEKKEKYMCVGLFFYHCNRIPERSTFRRKDTF